MWRFWQRLEVSGVKAVMAMLATAGKAQGGKGPGLETAPLTPRILPLPLPLSPLALVLVLVPVLVPVLVLVPTRTGRCGRRRSTG
jgi:hypothetical protein